MKKGCAIFILLFVLLSCKKEQGSTDVLTGSWRLIQVYNDSLHDSIPHPVDAGRDFIITFKNTHGFAGQTFKNTFFDGSYTLSNINHLRFGSYDATKIAEDRWGVKFNEVLMSCILQSVSPCTPLIVYVENKRLTITTFYRDNLLFEKI